MKNNKMDSKELISIIDAISPTLPFLPQPQKTIIYENILKLISAAEMLIELERDIKKYLEYKSLYCVCEDEEMVCKNIFEEAWMSEMYNHVSDEEKLEWVKKANEEIQFIKDFEKEYESE